MTFPTPSFEYFHSAMSQSGGLPYESDSSDTLQPFVASKATKVPATQYSPPAPIPQPLGKDLVKDEQSVSPKFHNPG